MIAFLSEQGSVWLLQCHEGGSVSSLQSIGLVPAWTVIESSILDVFYIGR